MTKELDITNHIGYLPRVTGWWSGTGRLLSPDSRRRSKAAPPGCEDPQRQAVMGEPDPPTLRTSGFKPPSLSCQATEAPAFPCVGLPRRKPAFASGGETVSSVKILPHRGRGTAGAAGGGGVFPADQTLTPLRHSLRECHLPFQGRIFKYLPWKGRYLGAHPPPMAEAHQPFRTRVDPFPPVR